MIIMCTLFYISCMLIATETMEILLAKLPELTNLTDSDGNNALHCAAQKNYQHIMEMLLSKWADLAYKPNRER